MFSILEAKEGSRSNKTGYAAVSVFHLFLLVFIKVREAPKFIDSPTFRDVERCLDLKGMKLSHEF